MQVVERTARRESPGDVPATFSETWDGKARHALCNSVRRAVPGISAVEGYRAVHTLAAIIGDPLTIPDADREQARRDHLAIPSDGSMSPFMAPPDGWEARKHRAPNKDGLITARGKARVIGECACDVLAPANWFPSHYGPALPAGIRTRLYAALSALPRTMYGASAYEIDEITDLYFVGEIPRKVGTDAILAHEIGTDTDGTDSPDGEVRGVTGHAHHKATFPLRTHLPGLKPRKSEQATARSLPAHADRYGPDGKPSHIWIGHVLRPRGAHAVKVHKPRTVKASRTVATVKVSTAQQVADHAAKLDRGKRAVLTLNGVKLTVTRGQAGKLSLTAGKGTTVSGLRTTDAVRIHAARLAGIAS